MNFNYKMMYTRFLIGCGKFINRGIGFTHSYNADFPLIYDNISNCHSDSVLGFLYRYRNISQIM